MRLIYTTHDPEKGRAFANFLSSQGFENQLEMMRGTDWGQENYGDNFFKVWVFDEDSAEAAEKWATAFENDPKNPMFQKSGSKTTVIPSILANHEPLFPAKGPRKASISLQRKPGLSITSSLFLLCCIFYLISAMTSPKITEMPPKPFAIPVLLSSVDKEFYYDYPNKFELVDKFVKIFGAEKLQIPQMLPPEGQYLYKEIQKTFFWQGYYDKLIAFFQKGEIPNNNVPMFEKIREGEVWRLFTPALLHSDFLHIMFNMLWLLILGKQLEDRLHLRNYMLLILIIGIVSNTCQYLMSGPNFMGFSGVICGMVAFIWVRQKSAPWEGYPLEKSTSLFLFCFIGALFLLQIVSFYFEVHNSTSFSSGIANTAHISGAITGALLGLLPLFKKRVKYGGLSR
jgi:GlpG protein